MDTPTSHRFRRFVFMIVVSVAAPAIIGGAQPVLQLTPEEAVRLGLDSSPRLVAARAEAEEARAAWREAQSARLPAVRADASFTRILSDVPEVEFSFPGFDTTFTILPVELSRYHSELSVEQPLFGGFSTRHLIRAAAARAASAEAQLSRREADLALEIRTAYWTLVGAVAVSDATSTSRTYVDRLLEDVSNRFEEGTVLYRDVLAARTRQLEVRLEEVEADNAVRVAELTLKQALGVPLDVDVIPSVSDPESPPPADAGSPLEFVEDHPLLRALEDLVTALRRDVSAARTGRLPRLSAIGRYIYARPNPYFFTEQDAFRGTAEVGLSLRWSIFEGGAIAARTRQAQARLEAAEANLAEARRQLTIDRERQRLEVVRASEALAVAAQHLDEARETFRVVRHQFDEEAALPADLLEAEQVFRLALARGARANAELAKARAALVHAEGRVW